MWFYDLITSLPFGIVALIAGGVLMGLFVTINRITIQSLRPIQKYQTTTTYDPAVTVWIGSIMVMLGTAMIMSFQLSQNSFPYRQYVVGALVLGVFFLIGMVSRTVRQNIHHDDPAVKLGNAMTVLNVSAALVPLMVTILAASGVAQAVGADSGTLMMIVLFFVLALPSATGATIVFLFSRSVGNPAYIYGTISVIGVILSLLSVLMLTPVT